MKELLHCMDAIPQGVYLVGTKKGEGYNLMTAAFVTQVSFNPASLAVSVAKPHYTAELIQAQGEFTLSILAEDQYQAAKDCGFQSGRKADKASRVAYHLEDGLPVLDGAAAWLRCKLRETVDFEDHHLFLAEITAGERTDKPPMIYHSEEFFG